MPWEAWLTLTVVALCVGLLASNRYPPDVVMLGGLTLLLLAGVITPADALSGLSNEGMVTVAVLYVVVFGLQETGGTARVSQALLRRPRSLARAQLRLMAPVFVPKRVPEQHASGGDVHPGGAGLGQAA